MQRNPRTPDALRTRIEMPLDSDHFDLIREEINRHLIDTQSSKLGHWHAARIYERTHKFYLGLPATIFSIVLAWLISSQTQTALPDIGAKQTIIIQISVILSLIVSLLSGLTAFLNLNDSASRHRNAAESLHALWRECMNWNTDFPDSQQCADAMKRAQIYRQRLNDINRDAPQIPRWAWKSIKKQTDEGSVSYT